MVTLNMNLSFATDLVAASDALTIASIIVTVLSNVHCRFLSQSELLSYPFGSHSLAFQKFQEGEPLLGYLPLCPLP